MVTPTGGARVLSIEEMMDTHGEFFADSPGVRLDERRAVGRRRGLRGRSSTTDRSGTRG